MNKVFMNRSMSPEDTYNRQKEFVDTVLKLEYDIVERNINNTFFTSTIQIKGHRHRQCRYSTTEGKGTSRFECLASNYGELIERYSYNKWIEDHDENSTVNLTSLTSGDTYTIRSGDVPRFIGTEASGNTVEDARYHALCEVLEIGFNNSIFNDIPIDIGIIRTEKMFPELPQILHDNIVVTFAQDSRLPLYCVTVIRCPTPADPLMHSLIDIDHKNKHVSVTPINWNTMNPNCATDPNMPWPALSGTRVGMNIKKTVKIALAEMVQLLGDKDLILSNSPKKRDASHFLPYYDALEMQDYETDTIEGDNAEILKCFKNAGYNLYELDISCSKEFPVIRILHDYTAGAAHPCSKMFLNKYFDLD